MFECYKDKVVFLMVYTREAHPASASQTAEDAGWKVLTGKDGEKVVYHQPKTYEDRQKLAKTACTFWDMPIPTLVDTVEPSVGGTYQAWPNRIYFIGKDGKILYRGPKGPMGASARPAEDYLRKHFGIEGDHVTKDSGRSSMFSTGGRSGSRSRESRERR